MKTRARTHRAPGQAAPLLAAAVLLLAPLSAATPAAAQWESWRDRDRGGSGISMSMFATFVEPGDRIIYPFFEHYRDADAEYESAELGYSDDTTERFGKYRANEGLLFFGWGIDERWAFEWEVAVISARLERAPDDLTGTPDVLEQSGLGDVEGQLRYRWREETAEHSEIFSYFETVLPVQKRKKLIGTSSWEFKFGTGWMRTHSWGTLVLRGAVAYADGAPELGEYAVEYIRGISDALRIYTGFEGSEDEIELITEAQITLAPWAVLKLNSAFGVTAKATDWAPEVGIAIRF